jgi:sugar lactone lactonase YvrE
MNLVVDPIFSTFRTHRVSFLALALAASCGATAIGCSDSTGATPVDADAGGSIDAGDGTDGGALDGGGDCPTTGAGDGSVVVTISGLPSGVNAKIFVDGAAAAVTQTTTLPLPNGPHTFTAERVKQSDPIVGTVFVPTVSTPTICAKAGTAGAVTVTYAAIASSHSLWLTHGNGDGEVASVGASALSATGSTAATTFEVGVPSAASVAFDRDGNMWISSGSGEVRRFPAAQLGSGGTKTPDVTLTGGPLAGGVPGPGPIALDKNGDLWVGLIAQHSIAKITRASYLANDPTAAVTLSGAALDTVGAMAFDASGNLYVGTGDKLLRYDAAHLAATSAAAPERTITANTPGPSVNTLSTPSGLAFDASGNLWVAYFAANAIARFVPADLAGTGDVTQTPAVQVTIAVTALLEEIAFDESGGLWLTYTNGKIARLGPPQLTATGTVTPSTVVTATGLGDAKGVAFFPAPASSPLYSAIE